MDNAYRTIEPELFHYSHDISANMADAHYHETYEIYFLISGKRRYFIDHKIYDLEPGDMILIPKNVIHKVLNTQDTGESEYHKRYLLTPREEQIPANLLHCFNQNYYHLPPADSEKVLHLIQEIQHELASKDSYSQQLCIAHLTNILTVLARSAAQSDNVKLLPIDYIMQDASLYIKNNSDTNITLSEVARKYFFSKEYFSAEFKKSTGFGFSEYLNQIRVARAIHLLLNTNLRIIEISNICGYNDSNYFSLVFKKLTGTTPLKYRKERTHVINKSANQNG